MDNCFGKGLMFPDEECWNKMKSDFSFLYAPDDYDGGTNMPNIVESETEYSLTEPFDLNGCKKNLVGESEETRIPKSSETNAALGERAEENQKGENTITSTITSLAGYTNLGYPIIKSLKTISSNPDANLKETERKLRKIVANLQTVVETVDTLQNVISDSQLPTERAASLKNVIELKSKAILEKCELANALTNMVKRISHIYDKPMESNSASKTFGSSVELP